MPKPVKVIKLDPKTKKKIKKYVCKDDGFKIDPENPKKCVKMSPQEIKARKKAAKIAAKKRKAKAKEIAKKRLKTLKMKKAAGLESFLAESVETDVTPIEESILAEALNEEEVVLPDPEEAEIEVIDNEDDALDTIEEDPDADYVAVDLDDIEDEIEDEDGEILEGVKIIKVKCKKDGFRYDPKAGKCVKMSPEEIKKRQKAAKIAAKLRKAKAAEIAKKRAKTMAKNKAMGVQKVIKYKESL